MIFKNPFRRCVVYDYLQHPWVSNVIMNPPYGDTMEVRFYVIDYRPLVGDYMIFPHGITGRSIMYRVIESHPKVADVMCKTTLKHISKENSEYIMKKYMK